MGIEDVGPHCLNKEYVITRVDSRRVHVRDDGVDGVLQCVHEARQAGDGVPRGGVHYEEQGGEKHQPLHLLLHLQEARLVQHHRLVAT